jgi:hypothetical protein
MSVLVRPDARTQVLVVLAVVTCALTVFWKTAFPTITWWDSSSYSLAAQTLGVGSPPGSLLLTILGWITTRLPIPLPGAQTLNYLAGALAAAAAALVVIAAVRIHKVLNGADETRRGAIAVGASVGALTLAFGVTLWDYAIRFTPYVLTVVFTVLILLALIRWWEVAKQPDAWRALLLVTFLFGLDFSVHRTNALLIPGAVAWILVRHPRTLLDARSWCAAIGGMVLGLTFHLLIMPISAHTSSPLNMFQPDTWPRFWDYVSLANTGGNFQLALWPRNSPFWSNQVADVVRVFAANFAHHKTEFGVLGWLPLIAGIVGMSVMWRRSPRLAVAFSLLLLLQAAATVLYFNIPANYFRSLDRHYLPILATFSVAIALGTCAVFEVLARLWKQKPILVAIGTLATLVLPVEQLVRNWSALDASRRFFTRDYALNALLALPENAFYFTVGDNDTFPIMYVQAVEGVRRDIRLINLSLANTDWYIEQYRRRDPSFPVLGTSKDRQAANASAWRDTTLVLRLDALTRTDSSTGVPESDSVVFKPRPQYGGEPLPADDVMMDIVRASSFLTPVTVSRTSGPSGLAWFQPNARSDGMHFTLVPVRNPPADVELLRESLLQRNEYRGFADPTVVLEPVTKIMGSLYRDAFRTLIEAESTAGSITSCRALAARVDSLLPPRRVTPSQPTSLGASCGR